MPPTGANVDWDALIAQAQANDDAEDSAVTVLTQFQTTSAAQAAQMQVLATQLANSPQGPDMQALATSMKTHADTLKSKLDEIAGAIVANTPAATP